MGTPNPFGDQPPNNPYGMTGGGMNPYMAQQYNGYNQFGGGMPAAGNPYAAYGNMGMGQPQANMFGYSDPYGQYGGQMPAQMNTNTYSVPSNNMPPQNAGAALFGVSAPSTTAAPNPGAALFGGAPAPAAAAPDNPFAAPVTDNSGAPTPAPIESQSTGGDVNPFAEATEPPNKQVFSPLGGSAVGTPHRGSIATGAEAEVNPFSEVTSAVSAVTSPPVPEANPFGSPAPAPVAPQTTEAENPFGDATTKVAEQPPAVLVKQDSAFSVKSNSSVASAAAQAAVKEMVGGLDESTADMIDKIENATTPTTVTKVDSAESSETESDTESESGGKKEIAEEDDDDDNQEEEEEEIKTEKVVVRQIKSDSESESESEDTPAPAVEEKEEKGEKEAEPKAEEKPAESESESESESQSKSAEPAPGFMTGGTAAGLFDGDSSGDVGGTAASIFSDSAEPTKPGLSTGHAIFTDAPSVPNIASTGAAIFGIGDESAAGSTGAAIFDIQAPTAQPCHGEMRGWDEAFDKKFDTVSTAVMNPNVAFDAFGAAGAVQATPFGYPGVDTAQDDTAFCDSFGMASLEADLNNPFKSDGLPGPGGAKSGDGESPDSILFEADTSKPLDAWPGITYDGNGWEMFIRHPPKKKITAQRYWKKVWVRVVMQADTPAVLLFNHKDDKDPIQELPLQAAYSLSDISHQVFDQFTKVFTIKLQYIFYKERAGIRPGQVTKMQKLTDKIGMLAKAVEDADLKGVKNFASDMKKLGVPLEHAPQISELLKLASFNYEDMKMFSSIIEEKLFRVEVNRDKALTYKTEECQLTAVEEVLVDQDAEGHVSRKICRVRVFFLSFLTGMPMVELGVNDMTRIGKEVVGRHDILPVPTEQWIRYEDIEFHNVVDKKAFEDEDHILKFQPPDACYIEVMRFRCRPPRARELPVQARCSFQIINKKVEIRADVMVPYHATKAWGQVPCEDVCIRIPIPEAWVYQFRNEKLDVTMGKVKGALSTGNINFATRMGAVKSAHRRAGKVKGLDRFLGTMETAKQDLMETSSGEAKYEHQHKAVVWRIPRLPKHGQGSYTTHEFVAKLYLSDFDMEKMPQFEEMEQHFLVEFNQPATSESYTVLRSVSIQDGSGEPPEKFVKYLARHEYKVGINFISEKEQDSYRAMTARAPEPAPEPEKEMREYEDFPDENGRKDSDSDSD